MQETGKTLRVGATVAIASTKRRGKIVEGPNRRGEFLVEIGNISLWAAPKNLQLVHSGAGSSGAGSSGASSSGVRPSGITPTSSALEPAHDPKPSTIRRRRGSQSSAGGTSGGSVSNNATIRLDVHGMTRAQALEQLESTIDRALLSGSDRIELIHGLGTGTLKEATHHYLKRSRHVRNYKLDDLNPGSTWIYL